jgi:hypothetical protein
MIVLPLGVRVWLVLVGLRLHAVSFVKLYPGHQTRLRGQRPGG